ncbi:TetR/AcrR family transcriptional regulator [Streptomyces fungicidicus]|uniref:TetR/AcrR family transcriptional regulator n=1 Tax=Streptomyces fungicidicus TaxID=68203 RepID=UPI00384E5BEF
MEPFLSALTGPYGAPSVLESAFADVVEGADRGDEMSARLLDAAYEQFRRMGVKRSTMTDVARLAGVSRITVHRRFATKDELVEQVVRREFRRYCGRFIVGWSGR